MNALNAYNKLNTNVAGLKKSSEKLSSGYRINRAGDDAAGLAISEKMRSQIRGLNQAKRNSQDGISMIQTFEGATNESHSILQRMKELASESANGTYQNEVDRDAIQLEFNQLNDELDQIADTDFNGVVMLNGGTMADGTKAVDGKFDYANNTRAAKQLGAADINKIDYQVFDDIKNTNGITKADTVWNDLNSDWDRNAANNGEDGPESIDITLKYDSTANTWTVDSASNGADKTKITVGKTANGGFKLSTANVDGFANVVLDSSTLKNGDTMVITLNNPKANISAPTNAGVAEIDKSDLKQGTAAGAFKVDDANFTVTIDGGLDDAGMTEPINKLFDQLNGATVSAKYTNDAATAAGDITITLKDGTEIKGDADGTFTLKDGTQFYATKATAGELKISTVNAAGTGAEKDLITIGITAATKVAGNTTGTMTGKIAIDNNRYSVAEKPTVAIKEPNDGAVSKANSNGTATAPLTYSDHMVLQTGSRTKDSVDFTFKYTTDGMGDLKSNLDLSSRDNGLGTKNLSLATQVDANTAIDKIDNAINKVSMVRATFGATQNRLEHKIENLTTNTENLTEAESTIRDTDMASEMLNYTKYNVLQQAAQSMLAQANQQPQSILQLLG